MKGQRRMVQPAKCEVEVETSLRVELPLLLHQRLKLEVMRRQRQGMRATLATVALEALANAQDRWPAVPED